MKSIKTFAILLIVLTPMMQLIAVPTAQMEYHGDIQEYINSDPTDIIVPTIRIDNPYEAEGVATITNKTELIMWFINFLLSLVAIISILFIIIGGYMYITARGDESQMEKAKKLIVGVIIGIIVIIAAYTIVATLLNFGATSSA